MGAAEGHARVSNSQLQSRVQCILLTSVLQVICRSVPCEPKRCTGTEILNAVGVMQRHVFGFAVVVATAAHSLSAQRNNTNLTPCCYKRFGWDWTTRQGTPQKINPLPPLRTDSAKKILNPSRNVHRKRMRKQMRGGNNRLAADSALETGVHFARTHHWDEFLPLLFDTNDDHTSEYDDDSDSKWIKMETKKGSVIKTRD